MRTRSAAVFAVLLACAPPALPHHGFTPHFNPAKIIRIEGTVKKVAFINPHGSLQIDTVDKSGKHVVYVCDLQARNQMLRLGVTPETFSVGDPIVVEGFEAWTDPHHCEFGVAHLANGRSLTLRSLDKAETVWAKDLALPASGNANQTIFGNWIRAGLVGDASGTGPTSGEASITAAGKAALAAYDPLTDNPVVHCRGGSPVRNWGAPGLTTAIVWSGRDILIQHETMDIRRTIHMDVPARPAGIKPSEMGYSIGHFEGDTLVVDTANFTPGVLTGEIMKSGQLRLQERISINRDNGRLLIAWQAHDPAYYAQPIRGSQLLQRTGKPLLKYGCVPGQH